METTSVTVAVCTFRRNEQLAAALPLLLAQADSVDPQRYSVEVLVVDNNPQPDAARVVEQSRGASSSALRYVHQPEPGLSAARNAALREANGALLAFIDDDEEPSPQWLSELLRTQELWGSSGVVGPILVRYEERPSPWILAGGFFDRPRFPTGTSRPAGHTSNLLLDLGFVRRHGLSFREEFGLAGGEDTMLTMEMVQCGGLIVWCDEAPVTDLVPAARLTREWVLNRRYRMGNSHSRCMLQLQSEPLHRLVLRLRLIVGGAARVAVGAALAATGRLGRSLRLDAKGARLLARGSGIMAGAVGKQFEEYQRSAPLARQVAL